MRSLTTDDTPTILPLSMAAEPPPPTRITFFRRLLPLVTSGLKTITIRDASESHYQPGSTVDVFPYQQPQEQQEQGQHEPAVCRVVIDSVEAISWHDLDETHARQETMALPQLKRLLREIYPDTDQLYVISYHLTPPPLLWQKVTSYAAILWFRLFGD